MTQIKLPPMNSGRFSFERVANLAVCGKRQPFLGHGGPGNVTAQAFEFVRV